MNLPNTLLTLPRLLTRKDVQRISVLLLITFVAGIFETFSVAAIAPFIALISSGADSSAWFLPRLRALFNPDTQIQFVAFCGGLVLLMLVLGNSISAVALVLMNRFLYLKKHELSTGLFSSYLRQDYAFFHGNNSSDLTKNIISTVHQAVAGVMVPLIQAVSRVAIVAGIIALLIVVDPFLAMKIGGCLGIIYLIIHMLARRSLVSHGAAIIASEKERTRYVMEAFHSIKEVKIFHLEKYFEEHFAAPSYQHSISLAASDSIAATPRYALEILAFFAILSIIIFSLFADGGQSPSASLPYIALYFFAAYRLMSGLAVIFHSVSRIRTNLASVGLLAEHFSKSPPPEDHGERVVESPGPLRCVELSRMCFSYVGDKFVVNDINLSIPAGKMVAIVGRSGAGKSTLADIIIGLLPPTRGELIIDGSVLTSSGVRAWQDKIGYVPQHIALLEGTIAKNIAVGMVGDKVDMDLVVSAGRMAKLDAIVADMPDGYGTMIGEKGITLSGGQRQRIGIARALYRNPLLLVLDEATSALDNLSEVAVMEAIRELQGSRTIIIITHRNSTVMECDWIVVLDEGRVAAQGSYAELRDSCEAFRRLLTM